MARHPDGPTPLTPLSMHILLALAERDLHGYALLKAIREQSGGAVSPGTGSLYAALQRLVDDGMIAEVEPAQQDARRGNAYRLTADGQCAAAAEAERLRGVVDLAVDRKIVAGAKRG